MNSNQLNYQYNVPGGEFRRKVEEVKKTPYKNRKKLNEKLGTIKYSLLNHCA